MYLLRLLLTTLAFLAPIIIVGVLLGLLVKFKSKLPTWLYWVLFIVLILLLVAVIGFTALLALAVFNDLGGAFVDKL